MHPSLQKKWTNTGILVQAKNPVLAAAMAERHQAVVVLRAAVKHCKKNLRWYLRLLLRSTMTLKEAWKMIQLNGKGRG
jgi:hypothetical protein